MLHLNNSSGNTFRVPLLSNITDQTGITSYYCKIISDQTSDYKYFVLNTSGVTQNTNYNIFTLTLSAATSTGVTINILKNMVEGQYTLYIYSQNSQNSLDLNSISRLLKVIKVQVNPTVATKNVVNTTDTKKICEI